MTTEFPKLIRKVRQRLGLSQEGLSRRLNATKAAIQHWERGRNQPDLARVLLLRSMCPPCPERNELDEMIRRMKDRVAGGGREPRGASGKWQAGLTGSQMLERENARLRQQIARLQSANDRRSEQLRILGDVAADLQRQISEVKAQKAATESKPETVAAE